MGNLYKLPHVLMSLIIIFHFIHESMHFKYSNDINSY